MDVINFATKLIKDAGDKLLSKAHKHHKMVWGEKEFEGYKTIKSDADMESDALVISAIKQAFPKHKILSEESGYYSPNDADDYTWIVDPLHSTTEYARGSIPEFSITIAIAKGSEIEHAFLYQPMLDRLYSASKNKGAFLNQQPLHVSKLENLEHVYLSIQQNAFKYGDADKVVSLSKKVKRMYALGSAMFPELAAGKVDAVISYKQALYDYAASKLIVEEAGGRVTQADGSNIPLKFDNKRRYTIVATNGLLHETMLNGISNI